MRIPKVFNSNDWSKLVCVVIVGLSVAGDCEAFQPPSRASLGSWPRGFERNTGQTDRQVDFVYRGNGYTLFLTPGNAVLSGRNGDGAHERSVVRLRLIEARKGAAGKGLEQLPGTANYYAGRSSDQWRTNVPQYRRVRYRDVYPGVDLVYYGVEEQLEYDFIVAPGGNPSKLQVAIDGAKAELDANGDVLIGTGAGRVVMRRPIAFQVDNGVRREIPCEYRLDRNGRIRFRVGDFDRSRPLVIDPVLLYSTYLGGGGGEFGNGVAVDPAGNIYITGETASINFPTLNPAYTDPDGAFSDAFVTKLSPTGALVYSTYLGGTGHDRGWAIAVDAAGNAYVTGEGTTAFPTTATAFDTTSNGGLDAFLTKLSPNGTILYSSLIGGGGSDFGEGVAVDASGNAYITGYTFGGFPTTPGAFRTSGLAAPDVFVVKLNPNASGSASLVYSTLLPGEFQDYAFGIAVDSSGNAYVTGFTGSIDFPTTPGAFDTTINGASHTYFDAFVTKINPTGSGLVYSTLLGGTVGEGGAGLRGGIAVDAAGNAYVTGSTFSTDFPVVNALQPMLRGAPSFRSAFVTKLNPTGSALVYSTYLGGANGHTDGYGITLDSAGNAFVVGQTFTDDFPSVNALQTCVYPVNDAFVSKLNSSGSALAYSTCFGSAGPGEAGRGIAVDASGNAYVTGYTTASSTFPTVNPTQPVSGGSSDAFVAKIGEPPADLSVTITDSPDPVPAGQNLTYSIGVTNQGPGSATGVSLTDALPSGATLITATPGQGSCVNAVGSVTCSLGSLSSGGMANVTVVVSPSAAGTISSTATVSGDQPDPNTGNNSATAATIVQLSNQAPSVSANSSSITVTEGSVAVAFGSYSDPNAGDTVTISASTGSVGKTGTSTGTWSWSLPTSDGPLTQTVTITADDGKGGIASTTFTLVVNNVVPTITALAQSAASVSENGSLDVTVSFSDPGLADSHTVVVNWGDGASTTAPLAAGINSLTLSHQYLDDKPTGTPSDTYSISISLTDKDGGSVSGTTAATVNNVAPIISALTGPPGPLAAGASAQLSASFSDPGTLDTHNCSFSWDDASSSNSAAAGGTCAASHTYTAAGVYTVSVTVTDDDTGTNSSRFEYVVVYDPAAGFVTGAGRIDSPAGAYALDTTLTGIATFGFTSKYQRGANVPSGETEFHFHVADFRFQSAAYDWLVVSGSKAQYKGSGMVNGASGYSFLLTATDGDRPGGGGADQFRIKIWNTASGALVYDNVAGASDDIDLANPQSIVQGSITIHAN